MSNINTLNVNGVSYNLTDSQAQSLLATLQTNLNTEIVDRKADVKSLQNSIEELSHILDWIDVD